MTRIAGIDLPSEKRLDIGLTYIFGIGRSNVKKIIEGTKIEAGKRIKSLTEDEINKVQKFIEKNFKVEGDLRQEIEGNHKRLREIGTYRGLREAKRLPVRGQRTRSNARTKRGKRMTIGALKKDDRVKLDTGTAAKPEEKK
jgi:small subunit ribosomal protein S13